MTKITKCECGSTEFTQDTQGYNILKVINGNLEIISNEIPPCNDAPIICRKCEAEYKEEDFDV